MIDIKFLWLLLLSACLSIGCTATKSSIQNQEASFIIIKKVLFDQQAAWNSGDIEAFMEGYWNSPELSFIGKSGITKGWDETLLNYKKGYPNKDAMGQLTFEVKKLRALSESVCIMNGKYTLQRKTDQPSGYFTLIWEKIDGRWLITSDHTSG